MAARSGRVILATAMVVVAVACGSKSTTPTTPSGPKTPTATKITLDVTPILKIGGTSQATATVTFDDGTTSTTAATLTGDNNAIATVSGTGLVTAIKAGTANVTAAASNLSVSQTVRVIPDVNGVWNGSAVVASCTTSTLNCQPNGTVVTFTVNIGQNDGTVPTAFFSTGGVTLTMTGTIATDGTLTMSGSGAISDPSVDTIKIQNWTSTSPSVGVMTGSFQLVGLQSGATLITTSYTIQSLTR